MNNNIRNCSPAAIHGARNIYRVYTVAFFTSRRIFMLIAQSWTIGGRPCLCHVGAQTVIAERICSARTPKTRGEEDHPVWGEGGGGSRQDYELEGRGPARTFRRCTALNMRRAANGFGRILPFSPPPPPSPRQRGRTRTDSPLGD